MGPGLAVLKLAGSGVSTIHAGEVSFVDAAVLDVSSLKVPAGTYKVIDARGIKETNLQFAEGTDTAKWSFRLDQSEGDLTLTLTKPLVGAGGQGLNIRGSVFSNR